LSFPAASRTIPPKARLTDVPKVLRAIGPWEFTKRVWKEIGEDNVFVWASALAYAWLFAIFPFFIFLLTLLPYLPPQVKAQTEGPLRNSIYSFLPDRSSADVVWSNVYKVMHEPRTGLLSVGILVTIWAASGGMAMTMAALDRCYDLPGYRPFYTLRPIAVLLTIVVATLIIAVLILLPVGTALTHFIRERNIQLISEGTLFLWNIARYTLALMFMLMVVAILYYFGPRVRQRFRFITPGAVFTLGVWLLLGFTFRIYVTKFGRFDKTYGTVGGVAILLLFFYIDALVLLVGAEINSEIDFAMGIPRGAFDHRKPPPAGEEEPEARSQEPEKKGVNSTEPVP
jgi:membrane protein